MLTAACSPPPVPFPPCSDAWLALLQLPVPSDIYTKVLIKIHESVIPNMINPNMLSDFLTFSLNQGEPRCMELAAFGW